MTAIYLVVNSKYIPLVKINITIDDSIRSRVYRWPAHADRIMLIMTLSSSIQELISSQMTDLRHYNTGGEGGLLGVC